MRERFERFTASLSGINRSMRRLKDSAMAKYSLRGSHAFFLYFLCRYQKLTAKQLEKLSTVDKAGVSRALEALCKEEYIAPFHAGGRKYRGTYVLTERGREAAEGLYRFVEDTVAIAGEGIDDSEREIFYRVLSKIEKNLEAAACGDSETDEEEA